MALLSSFSLPSSTFHQKKCLPSSMATSSSTPKSRVVIKSVDGDTGSSNAVQVSYPYTLKSRMSVIVKALSEIDGTGATSSDAAPDSEKPAMSVENLPLESKLQEKLDQKLRMKLAKKIRLRRKRLVRKRQLRKKGRWPPSKMKKLKNVTPLRDLSVSFIQRHGFSSLASSESAEKEAVVNGSENATTVERDSSAKEARDQSESDTEEDLSVNDLVKLVTEKEELLQTKQKELEVMKYNVLRSYAEMENVIQRTKGEAENSKKFAIQSFVKDLLDVADNLGRASSVVKESFSKIDTSKDSSAAVPLLKTLLEGVEMTEKQLQDVLKKAGIEKYEPVDEQFDPTDIMRFFKYVMLLSLLTQSPLF